MFSWDALLSYDAFDRLISETLYDTNTIYTTTYTYDKNNNRLAKHLQKGLDRDVNRFEERYSYTVNSLNQVIGIEKRHWLVSSPNDVEVSNTVINYDTRGNVIQINEGTKSTTINYDDFDMLISTISGSETSINDYDYRGRRVMHGFRGTNTDYETSYTYSDGTSVSETKLDLNDASEKTTLFYRGSDQGGGVGGINYSEFSNGDGLNYKFYNLRGDVVMTIDSNNVRKNKYLYFGFGKNELERGSEIETDKHRANTKVEDENNFLNEGKRFRHLELDVFLTPDPLEYVDGFNPYIYCSQNPWGKWDPEGLFGDGETYDEYKDRLKEAEKNAKDKPTLFAVARLLGIKETGRIKGHSNFSGSDKFDFTKEDRDMWTSPFNPFSTDRHFRALEQTEKEIAEAINSLNKDAFERAMHRGQDYFSHYAKGYRWDPQNGKFGHLQDGDAPDKDKRAWSKAEEWTKKWLDKWNEAVKRKDSDKESKDKEVNKEANKECELKKNSTKKSSKTSKEESEEKKE